MFFDMERESKLKLKEKLRELEIRGLKFVAKLCSVGVAVPSVTASHSTFASVNIVLPTMS